MALLMALLSHDLIVDGNSKYKPFSHKMLM